jgi:nicotinamide-nucleotide amidase
VKVATLSIGDELLTGEVVDSNAARIARELYAVGVPVRRHLTVGDREDAIAMALQELASGHDAVIITGGLGPTDDDLTARAAARAIGCRLVVHEDALAHLRTFAGRIGETLHPLNDRQALLPAKATVLPNLCGTASGFVAVLGTARLFFLPGVPREMAAMLVNEALPRLLALWGNHGAVASRTLRTFGLPEADLDARLQGVLSPEGGVTLAYGVEFPDVLIRLRGTGSTPAAVEESLVAATLAVSRELRELLVSSDGRSVEAVVAGILSSQGMTLAVAESCTGGLIAKMLTDQAGSSAYFREGLVTYADEAKARLLGVPAELLATQGAVSAEVARAMAVGLLQRATVDLALATTGIAGPTGGSAAKPVGTVFIALASRSATWVKQYRLNGDRDEVRRLTAATTLDWLRRYLERGVAVP